MLGDSDSLLLNGAQEGMDDDDDMILMMRMRMRMMIMTIMMDRIWPLAQIAGLPSYTTVNFYFDMGVDDDSPRMVNDGSEE